MKGNQIIVSSPAMGKFLEGTLDTSGTPKPGTIMQRKAATAADDNGQHTWTEYNTSDDGDFPLGAIAVLLEKGEGYTYSDAYADGDHCFLYQPLPGDQLNMLWSASGTGTGDSVAVGDAAEIDDGSGLLIDYDDGTTKPFIALEAVTDVVATGTLVWSEFTGY